MFSATVSTPIAALAKRYQKGAVRIAVTGERAPHHDIEYRAHLVAPNDRDNAIVNVLLLHDARSALVFCGTRIRSEEHTSELQSLMRISYAVFCLKKKKKKIKIKTMQINLIIINKCGL